MEKDWQTKNPSTGLRADPSAKLRAEPSAWLIVKLGEVCDVGAGNSAPQKKELFVDGKYPFFRTADVG
ncbi:MAG: hypothetical protein HF967_10670, partial [Methanosarcinales archaeon]|nr:hypothetical protein [Methanosarcinales archaeon]